MKRNHLASIAVLLALVVIGASAWAQAPTREFAPVQNGQVEFGEYVETYRPGRLLVKFTPQAASEVQFRVESAQRSTGEPATGLVGVDQKIAPFALRELNPMLVRQPANQLMSVNSGADRWYALDFDVRGDMEALARSLRGDFAVEEAVPDYRAFPAAVPNDPLHADHWGHNNTAQLPDLDWGGTYEHDLPTTVGTVGFDANALAAWDQGYGSSSVVIAIIDSGVDAGHPDLRQVTGYDFGDNDTNPDDNSGDPGHGTACAGVAASMQNNGLGAAGIAGGASIMPLKVANNAGSMYFSAIVNAIYYAADNGADIISMSLGAPVTSDPATDAALQYAYNAGCTILAATGNENVSTVGYPAINQYVIAVGAASPCGERKRSSSSSTEVNPGISTDPNGYTCDGERWWGSNWGGTTQDAANAVDILGPTILPTTDIQGSGGYDSGDYSGFFNGTSCATPYVAGVAALIKSHNPTWTPAQIRQQLRDTAQDVISVESGSGWDRYTGYGMVDAAAAVGAGSTPVAPTAAFTATPLSGTFPLDVQFTDQSAGAPTSWSWNFGDGGSSTAQNPGYTYNSVGSYTVTLTATNAQGSDDEVKVAYITVTEPGAVVVSTALADLPSLGSVSGTYVATWAADGTSQVITETISDNHPRKTTSWLEHSWRFDVAGGDAVDFELRASGGSGDGDTFAFEWSMDQATWNALVTVSSATMQDYTVGLPTSTAGTVYVRVTDTNRTWGATSLDAVTVDYLAFETGGGTPQPPVADFAGAPTSGEYPLVVSFTDQSSGNPTSWAWDFGDGGTATTQNPGHTYNAAGVYSVSLTVDNGIGSDSVTKTDYITVTEPGTGGDTMHVASLVVSRKVAGPNVNGQATVRIEDAGGVPVANATVTMLATGPVGGTYSVLTGADGSGTVTTGKVKNPSGEWCFEVTDVTHGTLSYDSGANAVTKACESGTVFAAGVNRVEMSLSATPNPFNPATEIQFGLLQTGHVKLDVYDVRGRHVATLLDEVRSTGTHSVSWKPSALASGVYFARMITPQGVQTQRLLLLK